MSDILNQLILKHNKVVNNIVYLSFAEYTYEELEQELTASNIEHCYIKTTEADYLCLGSNPTKKDIVHVLKRSELSFFTFLLSIYIGFWVVFACEDSCSVLQDILSAISVLNFILILLVPVILVALLLIRKTHKEICSELKQIDGKHYEFK